jgi:hypothetical protein
MYLRIFLTLILVGMLAACSDEPAGVPMDRYVYYSESGKGLFRYSIDRAVIEQVTEDKVVWITQVAENGIVLYAAQTNAITRFWGVCDDGSIIPVPMPVAESASEEYVLSNTPIALSYKGHHAAWVMHRRTLASTDSTTWTTELCVFDCAVWKMKKADVGAHVRTLLSGTGFSADIVTVHSVHLTDYGDAVVLVVHIIDTKGGAGHEVRTVVLAFDGVGFQLLDSLDPENGGKLTQVAFDTRTGTFYAYPPWKSPYAVDCRTRDVRDLIIPHIPYAPFTPLTQHTSEFVESLHPSLSLRRMDTGQRTTVLADVTLALRSYTDIRHAGGHSPAISPDGQWVAMLWESDNDSHVLFAVRRDGEDLRRISKGRIPAPLSVSSVVPR